MSVWDLVDDSLGDRLARDLRDMVRAFDAAADRSQQVELGPSEIGKECTRCIARAVLGVRVQRPYDDPWCRVIGTATHAWLADAADADILRWAPEARVYPDDQLLPRGGRADLFDKETGTVIDHKVVGPEPLRKYRANGPGAQYRIQAHLYGLGFANAGEHVSNVAIAFWNRGGKLRDLYVWTEPFDPEVAHAALELYREIRSFALTLGTACLKYLPADPNCWDCGGLDVEIPSETA